jgi:hypothetical protein
MAVIGRLDDQVEEVIIAPIAGRHERKKQEQEGEKQPMTEELRQTENDENSKTDIPK